MSLNRWLWGLAALNVLVLATVLGLPSAVAPGTAPGITSGPGTVPPPGEDDESLQSYLHPDRDRWQQPARVFQAMHLQPGQTVADVGAGSGYFTYHLSRAVGGAGTVYAVDISPWAMSFLRRRMQQSPPPFPNVRLVSSGAENVGLGPDCCDHVLLCEAHFFVEDRLREQTRRCLASIHRALRPGGRLTVIELRLDPQRGPLTPERLRRPFLEAGFKLEAVHDFLYGERPRPPGEYLVVFRRD